MKHAIALALTALSLCSVQGVNLTSSPYSENFDSMGTAGSTAPAGWTVIGSTGGTSTAWLTTIPANEVVGGTANATLTASTTYSTNSGTAGFNYALASSSSDRALGTSPTSVQGVYLELSVTNATGAALSSVRIGYDIRCFTAASSANELPGYWLFYSLDGGSTWTNVSVLNPTLSGSSGVVVPNAVGVTTVPATVITLGSAWNAGSNLLFRWVDDNAGASSPDQILGLDNVTLSTTSGQPGSPPTVTLTAPAGTDAFTAPASISLAASASDPDGAITKVEFYNGSTKLGQDTTEPYTYDWSNVAQGTYSLTARATDNAGSVTTSSVVNCTVDSSAGSGSLTRGPYLQKAGPTRMTIRWRSSLSVKGRVKYGTSVGALTNVVDEAASTKEHEIQLTGLTPATTYFYSVGSASTILAGDANHTFTTPPNAGATPNTRIWVLGDAGLQGNGQLIVRDAFYSWTGTRTPDFVLQLGDNAYANGTDEQFQNWMFNIYGNMMRKTPFWSCLGNHETNGRPDFVDTYAYFGLYTFPTAGECGGVASGTEHYFSFNYGNIHCISLDTMTASRSPTGAMATWLKSDLASTTATWIIAFFHHPPYSQGSHLSDSEGQLTEVRQNLLPILEAGGVDLVLTGHSHSYERSYLLDGHYGTSNTLTAAMKVNGGNGRPLGNGAYTKPLTGPRDHKGAVYVVAGSSSQITGGPLNHPAMCISLNNLGSLVLDVSGSKLNATFLRENSSTPDTFSIFKQDAADSDGDGMSDEWEIANSLDRHNPADATLDADADGMTNLQECSAGTDPRLGTSKFTTGVAWTSTPGQTAITFLARAGKTYTVRYKDALSDPNWTVLAQLPAATSTGNVTVTDVPPTSAKKRFYQVATPSQP